MGIEDQHLTLRPCDVIVVRGTGWVSRAILRCTDGRVSHVGFCVRGGGLSTAIIQEAVWRVRRDTIASRYGGTGALVGIYRPHRLSTLDRAIILAAADQSLDLPYGYGKILLQLADAILPGHPYLFRRLGVSKYPICSGDTSRVFEADGLGFGVEVGAATPADIDKFVTTRTDKYTEIRVLAAIEAEGV